MARIEIIPLAVNGVAVPMNLLYKLFSNPLQPKNLSYPIDLATNPIYGHAIQFRVKEFKYKFDPQDPTGLFKGGVTQNTLSTLSLYMPDTLVSSFNHDWTQVSLTEQLGPIMLGAAVVGDGVFGGNGTNVDTGNKISWPVAAGTEALNYLSKGAAASVAGNIFKQVPNPQLQMLYKSIGLREFQFEFLFSPNSKKEAEAVDMIIQSFTYYSVPETLGAKSHQFLKPPEVFEISFGFTGDTGLTGIVSNFFNKLGMNITPSEFGPAKVCEIYHPCVLTDMTVDYAPSGWSAYTDGSPIQTRLTLNFKETDIVDKNVLLKKSSRSSFLKSITSIGS